MAGQSQRGTRGRRRPSRGVSSTVLAAASAAGSGSVATTVSKPRNTVATRPETRATYRMLILRGLAPEEAANLTAYVCGIHVESQPWKLGEVNRLLFLRELELAGRFGPGDGTTDLT